jgi:hypothetical protein
MANRWLWVVDPASQRSWSVDLYDNSLASLGAKVVALDDLTGYRDGSDITNYSPDKPLRRLARKPLVAGSP